MKKKLNGYLSLLYHILFYIHKSHQQISWKNHKSYKIIVSLTLYVTLYVNDLFYFIIKQKDLIKDTIHMNWYVICKQYKLIISSNR